MLLNSMYHGNYIQNKWNKQNNQHILIDLSGYAASLNSEDNEWNWRLYIRMWCVKYRKSLNNPAIYFPVNIVIWLSSVLFNI